MLRLNRLRIDLAACVGPVDVCGGELPLLGGREPAKYTLGVLTPVLAHPQCSLRVAHANRNVLYRLVVQHVRLLRLLNGL